MKLNRTFVAGMTALVLLGSATACSNPHSVTHTTVVHHVYTTPNPVHTVVHVYVAPKVSKTPKPVKTSAKPKTTLKQKVKKLVTRKK